MRIDVVLILCIISRMIDESPSHAALLSLWKWHSQLAADMDVPKWRARQWRARGSIPPKYWPRFITAMRERFGREVSADELLAGYNDAALPASQDSEAA
jgi:hypothetical protein